MKNVKFSLFPFLSFVLISISNISCSQIQSSHYEINKSIQKIVEANCAMVDGVLQGGIVLHLTQNGEELIPNDNMDVVPANIMAEWRKDTLLITEYIGLFTGIGFYLELHKDQYRLQFFISGDGGKYRLEGEDEVHDWGIAVPPVTQKVILTNKPSFKKGEWIKGVVELTSEHFYEIKEDQEDKLQGSLTGYFKIQVPSKSINQ